MHNYNEGKKALVLPMQSNKAYWDTVMVQCSVVETDPLHTSPISLNYAARLIFNPSLLPSWLFVGFVVWLLTLLRYSTFWPPHFHSTTCFSSLRIILSLLRRVSAPVSVSVLQSAFRFASKFTMLKDLRSKSSSRSKISHMKGQSGAHRTWIFEYFAYTFVEVNFSHLSWFVSVIKSGVFVGSGSEGTEHYM